MSAALALVTAVLATVPAQAGDTPYLSSVRVEPGYASGAVTAHEGGRLMPRPLRGYGAWQCARGRGRNLTCRAERLGRVRVLVTYRITGARSLTWAAARVVR